MRLVVGRIGRAHGIRGDVAVDVRTDDPDARFSEGAVLHTDPASVGPLTIASIRRHSGRLLVRFKGMADRDAAEALRGTTLLVDSEDIAPLDDPDEFHDHELIGLTAVTTDGETVGRIDDVLHHAQDVLVITAEAGHEVLVPFVAALVPEVDVAAGRLTLDPPPGLLDLQSTD
ncbi:MULTISPECIES: ribosome maturation factor RimM [Nocardiopsis]|jgi:16S rRNA processing protein RimM|uniref:Ribosome maturation factor RimM n=2 Tax=Nocardiopsis alba TaxID=53437 RepID=A0A7K2IVE6_9ACTN|nr:MULTISPECIES: ribosome maturation factor RimM [Nocardiopsis]AFR10169.1 16S rRNA processing protein RimM [Nocardiopsis alba ATCC BAA-2165]MEC3895054.1 ribosome maturation factor RimM [Nocardiopsis sp. LDBS1602]MYR33827.1 ribosome maturation factor RimM [Nocardiopsis alba]